MLSIVIPRNECQLAFAPTLFLLPRCCRHSNFWSRNGVDGVYCVQETKLLYIITKDMYFGVHSVQVRMSTTASCSVPVYGALTAVHSESIDASSRARPVKVPRILSFYGVNTIRSSLSNGWDPIPLYSECACSHWTKEDFLCLYAIKSGVLVSHEVWHETVEVTVEVLHLRPPQFAEPFSLKLLYCCFEFFDTALAHDLVIEILRPSQVCDDHLH